MRKDKLDGLMVFYRGQINLLINKLDDLEDDNLTEKQSNLIINIIDKLEEVNSIINKYHKKNRLR